MTGAVGPLAGWIDRCRKRALVVGATGCVLLAVGYVLGREHALHGYLLAFLFWSGVALGSTALLMLHHLVGGAWGILIRRALEAGTRTLPLMALLALPLLASVGRLYPWAGAGHGAEGLGHKAAYLNVPFFVARTLGYFAVWLALAYLLNRWSLEQDRTGAPAIRWRFQALSGPGLVLYGLTMTFAAIDWVMSLEPHWYSTVYGALFMVGQVLSTLAFATGLVVLLARFEPMSDAVSPARLHDLGNLMLAFVMLWAYLAFSQFLIIWAGNLPEEIPWYLRRLEGGWQAVAVALIVFHFVLPFFLLLSRDVKRRAGALSAVAAAVIVLRLVDLFWLVEPALHREGFALHWVDLAAPLAIGGIWIRVYLGALRRHPLLPVHDPLGEEATHA